MLKRRLNDPPRIAVSTGNVTNERINNSEISSIISIGKLYSTISTSNLSACARPFHPLSIRLPSKTVGSKLSATAKIFQPAANHVLHHPHHYPVDQLDCYVNALSEQLLRPVDYPLFVQAIRGKGDLQPTVKELPHPASHLLD